MKNTLKLKLLILAGLFLVTQSSGDQFFMKGFGWDGTALNIQYTQDLGAEYVRLDIAWNIIEQNLQAPYPTVAEVDGDPTIISDYISSVDWTVTDNRVSSLVGAGFTLVPRVVFGVTEKLPLISGDAATPDHDQLGREYYLGCAYRHVRAVIRQYKTDIHYWIIEGELNEAPLSVFFGWRDGTAWSDTGFLTELISTLHDAVRAEDPSAQIAIAFHTDIHKNIHHDPMAAIFAGPYHWTKWLAQWEQYLDIIGLDCYPNYYGADPNYGAEVGERVDIAREIAPDKPVVVFETAYPAPAPGVTLPEPVDFTETKQDQYVDDAISSVIEYGTSGFFYFAAKCTGVYDNYTAQDLEALSIIGPAFHDGNAAVLTTFFFNNFAYVQNTLPEVVQNVEAGLGIVRSDGSYRPAFYTLQSVYATDINKYPTASNLSIDPPSPTTQDGLTALYNFTDPDGGLESGSQRRWYMDGNHQAAYDDLSTLPSTATSKGQEWYYTVKPKDGTSFGARQTSPSVTIENAVPTADNLTLTPESPVTADNLVAGYEYNDADDDGENGTEIKWYMNGDYQGTYDGVLTIVFVVTAKGQVWHFTVKPGDGTDFGDLVTSSEVTIGNTAPEITSASIASDPDPAVETSILTASAAGWSDADGDLEGYKYQWYNQNGAIADATGSTLGGDDFSKGDEVYCMVTPFDGTDDGDARESNHITIANSPPTAPAVSITPENPSTTDDLTVQIDTASSDDDGDDITYSYAWYEGDVLQPDLTTDTAPASRTAKNKVWKCIVTPNDGTADGDSGEDSVTVVNSPPTEPTVDVVPDSPDTGDDIVCTITGPSTDPDDGDVITYNYEWYEKSTLQPELTSDTILSSLTESGQVWKCVVTPNDGTVDGPSGQDSVTLGNAAPVASDLMIIPASPLTGDNLFASYTYSDADDDEQSGTEIRWYNDGVPQTGYDDQDTVPSSATEKGEPWRFTVKPSDGTSFGELQTSDTTAIGNTPPTASNVVIDPESPVTGDDLTGDYEYDDVDDDQQNGTMIQWFMNDSLQGDYTGTLAVPSTATAKGQVWRLIITPGDGTDVGMAVSDSVTIGNTPPVADAGGFYEVESGEEVIFDGSGSFDVDGDSLTYQWDFGDNNTGTGVVPAHTFADDEIYTVTLIVSDGMASSDPSITTASVGIDLDVIQTIDLHVGWNLISFNTQPLDASIEAVLLPIQGKYDSVWRYSPNPGWSCYLPNAPAASNLTEIEVGIGYWIMVNHPCSLTVQGIQTTTGILLRVGWNLVGYCSEEPKAIADCMNSITEACSLVEQYDPVQGWLWYLPNLPEISNLEFLQPGMGLWIKVKQECIWDVSSF